MFCPNCGTKNADDAVFCENCGTRILEENPVQEQSSGVRLNKEEPLQGAAGVQPGVQNAVPYQAQPGMQNAMAQPAQQKKPFRLSKKLIAVIAAVAAVIIAIVVFVNVGKSVTDYKKIAAKYVKAVEEGDWDKAYGLMNLPEGEFLTKEAFIKANEEESSVKITNINVKDTGDLKNLLEDKESTTGNKSVIVTYSYPGSSSNIEYITLDQLGSKFLFFFNKYKVSSDGIVAFDSIIKVPVGSKLYINDVAVADSYKSSTKSTEKIDYYVIPYLFQGNNTVKVVSEYTQDLEEVVYFSGQGDSYSVSATSLSFKSDMVEAVKAQAKNDLEKIAAAAVAQKNFSEIGLTTLSSAESTLNNSYTRNALGDCHSSYRDVKSLSLESVSASVSSNNISIDSSDGLPYIRVSLSYGLKGTYVYRSNNETKEGKDSSSSSVFTYKYSDGQWRMCKMNISLYIS